MKLTLPSPGIAPAVMHLSALITLTILTSCSKSHNAAPVLTANFPSNVNVYTSVTATGPNGDSAMYFINKKEYPLSSGLTTAGATGIAVSGSDVYVAGYERINSSIAARLWKNQVAATLYQGSGDSKASGIAISGADVYITGYITNGAHTQPVYWKDEQLFTLPISGQNGAATGICISGADLYISGVDSANGTVNACYWKNGQETLLPSALPYTLASGIAVNATGVNVVGTSVSSDQFSFVNAQSWSNNSPVTLQGNTDTTHSSATCIYVNGSDVYIGGEKDNAAAYWKNGAPISVSEGPGGQINAITSYNNQLFAAGAQVNNTYTLACVWINADNVPVNFNGAFATATGIVVTGN